MINTSQNTSQSDGFSSLETLFTDNPVRFVDAFVEALSNTDFRFKIQTLKTEGRQTLILNCFLKYICTVI
jgi:hypothetical protein